MVDRDALHLGVRFEVSKSLTMDGGRERIEAAMFRLNTPAVFLETIDNGRRLAAPRPDNHALWR